MLDETKQFIDQELSDCLTPEELTLKYAQLYSFMKEQMHCCMKRLTKEDEKYVD